MPALGNWCEPKQAPHGRVVHELCQSIYVCLYVLPQIHSPAICVIGEFKLEPRISIVKYFSQL